MPTCDSSNRSPEGSVQSKALKNLPIFDAAFPLLPAVGDDCNPDETEEQALGLFRKAFFEWVGGQQTTQLSKSTSFLSLGSKSTNSAHLLSTAYSVTHSPLTWIAAAGSQPDSSDSIYPDICSSCFLRPPLSPAYLPKENSDSFQST